MGLLDGKVVLVTGAGGGLGRAHALAMAAEGARIVVNDVGVARDGTGADESMAARVVSEIRALGGQAVANRASVATVDGANWMVQSALDAFGRLDVVVNNAGILRDKTLVKMGEDMWDAVIAVHLKGSYAVSRAAALHFKERAEAGQAGGRIVNTTSYSGLLGNFGQANYSAAKAGIYGLTRTTSFELAKYGVTVNAIAPMAKTRMTEDIEQVPEEMRPEHVSPMIVFLASDLAAGVNGRVFGVHGTKVFEYRMTMSEGVDLGRAWTAREIADRLGEISGPSAQTATTTVEALTPRAPAAAESAIAALFAALPGAVRAEKAAGWKARLHFQIAGAGDWTLAIDDGKATSERGLSGQATCVVGTDAATFSGLMEGKVKGEEAFMAGKITASNLADMTRFGKAFDFKKLAGAPAAGPADRIGAIFHALPGAVSAEKAAGWKARIHFKVEGAGDWTLAVVEGRAASDRGLSGEPTCVIGTDAPTFAGLIEGTVKGEEAFMSGKITASNLADMTRFAKAFDFKKVAAQAAGSPAASPAAPAAPAPAAGPSPADVISAIFQGLPGAVRAEKVEGWKARIHFKVEGAGDWTLAVVEGRAATDRGLSGEPTCVISTDATTLSGLVAGKVKGEEAFMSGKLAASNLGDMTRFAKAFDFKKVAATAIGSPAEAPEPAAAEVVASVLQSLPEFVRADKAAGWKARLHFKVEGAGEWTLAIDEAKASVERGLTGEPTCVLTSDAATLGGMFRGKVKAEEAFMTGKIAASNLADMTRFGKAFDFKRIAAKFAPAAPAVDHGARVQTLLPRLPEVFLAEKAAGWSGAFVLDLGGASPWCVSVASGRASVEPGTADAPAAVVTADLETMAGVLDGSLDPQTAFLEGRVRASRIEGLMRFRRLFDFRSLPSRVVPPRPEGEGLNRAKVGSVIRVPALFARPGEMVDYALATNDPNPAYLDGKVAPPVFPVRLAKELFKAVFFDPDLRVDFAHLVHGEQDIRIHRLLRPWDLVSPRATISGIEDKSTGQVLTVEQRLLVDGEPVVEMTSRMFIRDRSRKKDEKKADTAPPRPEPDFRGRVKVSDDQPWRYADASGDDNPIHVNPEFAKSVGFPNVILQGLCTMAFAGKAVVDEVLGGNPNRLTRLAVRFSKPVLPEDRLETKIWRAGDGAVEFETVNQKGEPVLINGRAEFRG